MLIDTTEAGKILGISGQRVRTLVTKGLLKDHNPVNSEHKRHVVRVDAKEVREFKKGNVISSRVATAIPTTEDYKPAQGFSARLERIEAKLDTLLKIWS